MYWAVYLALVPIVSVWSMMSGWRTDRAELTRCGAVILGHGILMQVAALLWPPVAGEGYPFLFVTLTLAGALWLICRKPASRANALLAGSGLFGILVSLIYGVSVTWKGTSSHADWAYFAAQFTMGWANLVILLGWTHERSLGRVADYCLDSLARLVRRSRISGVAR